MITRLLKHYSIVLLATGLSISGCKPSIDQYTSIDSLPPIRPGYTSITIPPNIAPLNFVIEKNAENYFVKIASKSGPSILIQGKQKIQIPESAWKSLLNANKGNSLTIDVFVKQNKAWQKYKTIENHIATESLDTYLVYRLIEPLYENWKSMGIYQRCIENFDEKPILHNNLTQGQCMNCHSFQQNNTQNMLFHLRGKNGGTLIFDHENVTKINTKTAQTISAGVYPAWHPFKKLVAFSVNEIGQLFHSKNTEKIEVLDTRSDLVLYDVEKKQISHIVKTDPYFETFPAWSPDGKYLYFCSAKCPTDKPYSNKMRAFDITEHYADLKYNILRISFDPETGLFGTIDTVLNTGKTGKSASFPRVSPDGRYLMFSLSDYGNFSIWHKSSNLYVLDLKTNRLDSLAAVNSNDADSYHTWSSNGRWFVFSSRRIDGSYPRLYFSYFDKNGKGHKPFILPQKDPGYDGSLYKSYNVPELIKNPIQVPIHQLEKIAAGKAIPVTYITSVKQ